MQMQNLKLYLYFYLEHVLTYKISLKLAKNKGVMPNQNLVLFKKYGNVLWKFSDIFKMFKHSCSISIQLINVMSIGPKVRKL